MAAGRVEALAERLEGQGLNVPGLRDLQVELDAVERPPGFFKRLTSGVTQVAARQWKHVVGELQESREVMGILTKRMRDDAPLTPAETDKVRAQMLDLLRVVPAGVIAMANSALPVPGTGLFTPWILARMGLMPSRWREAHMLHELHKQAEKLRAAGHIQAAEQIEALEHDLEEEADARDRAAHAAALLTHWDANKNGTWDPDERAAYNLAVEDTARVHGHLASRKQWFLSCEDRVFGPVRLAEVASARGDSLLLVCFDGRSPWVCLDDLLDQAPLQSRL